MGLLKKRTRTLAGAAVLCLLFSLSPAAVYAQEPQQHSQTMLTTQVKGQSDIVEKGKGEVALSDGTVVTVEGESLTDGLLFLVEAIDQMDTNRYGWIAKCMEGLGNNLRIYDIYFVDGSGQRYEVTEKMTVTISLNGEFRSPTVYYVSSAGSVYRMESSVANDNISFETTHNSYYVLVEQEEEATKPIPAPGEETKPSGKNQTGGGTRGTSENKITQGAGVKTGDGTDLILWRGVFGCSSAVLAALIVRRERYTSGK